MLNKILIGKSREEITKDFLTKYKISSTDWKTFNSEITKNKMRNIFNLIISWFIFLVGITFIFTFLSLVVDGDNFPRIFKVEEPLFYQRLINVFYGIIIFFMACAFTFWGGKRMNKTYDIL